MDAYLAGDLDLVGDLVTGMDLRNLLRDTKLLDEGRGRSSNRCSLGRRRLNPGWVAKHYDSQNIQVYGLDQDYQVYTPGLYLDDDDSLEDGRRAQARLRLPRPEPRRRTHSVLDVGCGWGGFARYCARRGVDYTGISLLPAPVGVRERPAGQRKDLDADLRYQDFFAFEPERQFDAISLMGSIEELADYGAVLQRLNAMAQAGRSGLPGLRRRRPSVRRRLAS